MTPDFTNRSGVAIVTGGSGGIGSAICRVLAQRGSDVAFTFHRNRAKADELVAELAATGQRGGAWQVDLADAAAVRAFVATMVERFGGVHTLVHAAGPTVPQIHLSRVEPATFRAHLEQEVAAFFTIVHECLPHLRATAGSIVAVTTAATRRFPVRDGLSSGPKGAIEALVRGLAAEEGRFGVRANCVGPGMLSEGMAERLIASGDLSEEVLAAATRNIPLRRFGKAIDIAEMVCFLASDRANYISAQMIDVDGGYGA